MKHIFELTYKCGTTGRETAATIGEALHRRGCDPDIVKIEIVDNKVRREDIKRVNNYLSNSNFNRYHKAETVIPELTRVLQDCNFEVEKVCDIIIAGAEGAERCVPIGRDSYLCITWYRMSSGAYEIVAYVS